ncbi:hypothetical protein TNCV_1817031 [Trichonephila clavipes]|nr:hypothetical protein TNCV_1817031 [Trichonephila clavipes]
MIVLNEYSVAKEVLCNAAALDRSPDIFSHLRDIVKFMQKLMKWYNIQRKGPSGPVGLPVVGYLPFLGKEPHKTFRKMTEKYGDIIGFPCGKWRKTWVEQRRYCLSATRDLGLGRGHWEDLIMDEASSFMKYLTDLKGRPADISHAMACSITSNIISLLIGRRLKRHEEADKVELSIDYSDIAFTYTGPSYATAAIPGLRMFCEKFKIAGYDKAFEIIQKFSSFIRIIGTIWGVRGHQKDSDLQSNPLSETSSFSARYCCSQERNCDVKNAQKWIIFMIFSVT